MELVVACCKVLCQHLLRGIEVNDKELQLGLQASRSG
jgi:hypothetical protein